MSSAWEFGEARPTLHMFIQVSARPFCRGHLPCKANMMFNLNPNRIQCCWNKTKQALIIYNIIYCNSIMIIVIIVITCNNYTHIILIKNDNKLGNSLTPSTATSTGDLTRSSQSSAAGPHSSLPGGQATRQVSWDFTQETMGFWGFSEKTHGKKHRKWYVFWNPSSRQLSNSDSSPSFSFPSRMAIAIAMYCVYPIFKRSQIGNHRGIRFCWWCRSNCNVLNTWGTAKSKGWPNFPKKVTTSWEDLKQD